MILHQFLVQLLYWAVVILNPSTLTFLSLEFATVLSPAIVGFGGYQEITPSKSIYIISPPRLTTPVFADVAIGIG
jgi:hypothetical protein